MIFNWTKFESKSAAVKFPCERKKEVKIDQKKEILSAQDTKEVEMHGNSKRVIT